MKMLLSIVLLGGILAGAGAHPVTNAPARIELPDQFECMQQLVFPNTNVTLLTLADRKGSSQISGWIAPIKQQFGDRVDVRGIADVSAVPRLLRSKVRSAFRADMVYPVMMDWSGSEIRKFDPRADVATVLLIAGDGCILLRFEGRATTARVAELGRAIENQLREANMKGGVNP